MFTPEERSRLRLELLELAAHDRRLSGVAITGSVAADREDRWSDIDLAFGVDETNDLQTVLSDFTTCMYDRYCALHHIDLRVEAWIYRVFFLPGTLQVDLAFAPRAEFRPLGPTFRLVSGSANPFQRNESGGHRHIIGWGWLYALHARSCILRQKPWQAEYMISGVRDHALMLACMRHGLPSAHGRGIDQLPAALKEQLSASLIRELHTEALWRALETAVHVLLSEAHHADAEFAARIGNDLLQLCQQSF